MACVLRAGVCVLVNDILTHFFIFFFVGLIIALELSRLLKAILFLLGLAPIVHHNSFLQLFWAIQILPILTTF